MFSRIGAAAYKKDLHNTIELCNAIDNPQNKFKSIHIAGTNGKGSTSHMLAAILQQAGRDNQSFAGKSFNKQCTSVAVQRKCR